MHQHNLLNCFFFFVTFLHQSCIIITEACRGGGGQMWRQSFLTKLRGLHGRVNAKRAVFIKALCFPFCAFWMLMVNSGLKFPWTGAVLQKEWQNFWDCLTLGTPLSTLRYFSQSSKLLLNNFRKAPVSWAVLSELSDKTSTQFFLVSFQLCLLRMSARDSNGFNWFFSELFAWCSAFGLDLGVFLGNIW